MKRFTQHVEGQFGGQETAEPYTDFVNDSNASSISASLIPSGRSQSRRLPRIPATPLAITSRYRWVRVSPAWNS